jgi:hypothetical protein
MKKVKRTFGFALLIIVFTNCRKEVKEPTKIKGSQEYVYIEIDGEKFLVNDKKWNINKNTIGIIKDQYSKVADKIHYSNEFENTKLKKGQCKGGIDIAFNKTSGVQLPQYLRLMLKLDKDGQSPIYQIYADYDYNGTLNEFKDFKFTLINFDDEKNIVEYQFECSALCTQDNLFHKIVIKSKTIFN